MEQQVQHQHGAGVGRELQLLEVPAGCVQLNHLEAAADTAVSAPLVPNIKTQLDRGHLLQRLRQAVGGREVAKCQPVVQVRGEVEHVSGDALQLPDAPVYMYVCVCMYSIDCIYIE